MHHTTRIFTETDTWVRIQQPFSIIFTVSLQSASTRSGHMDEGSSKQRLHIPFLLHTRLYSYKAFIIHQCMDLLS